MLISRKIQLIFGLIIAVIFFVGLFMIGGENHNGTYLMYAGLGAGAAYWIWSIIVVIAAGDLKKYQRTFWLIIVIAVPFFGALLYNILHQSRNKIAA